MQEIDKDSPILEEMPEVYSLFQTYRYTVTFNPAALVINGGIVLYFNGEYRRIQNDTFQFDAMYKLSLKEIYKILEGTTGIKKIQGEFKK